ncbi:hypothetical protein H6P81_015361 [Aristolochia fimbriata]|uniref:C2H2-type domain-containing protein n=1 Tax=Aristolochia fimbriata TaxID=158543 RepID=A0AAV7E6I6_ARIFI|nr:hypothetical protein H6P81_015361 [Aristolochia fimbriata]
MAETKIKKKPTKKNQQKQREKQNKQSQKTEKPPQWAVMRKFGCSRSFCSIRDNTRVIHGAENTSPEAYRKLVSVSGGNDSKRSMKTPLNEINGVVSSSSSSAALGWSSRGMPLRRFSGCYECRMVVDPSHGLGRNQSLAVSVCTCSQCGEVFNKSENLELHQTVRHAVSELDPEDTSRNIVEIIFQSSWLKNQSPVCQIDRILKVHNSQTTIAKFENYRDSIKAKANKFPKKHPRCIADGNELLRFHCTTFICSIGMKGSTNLCNSIPFCNICNIIKNGFKVEGTGGISTTATSGRAHDNAFISSEKEKRAMLVCRVIAGRVKKSQDSTEDFDSVANPAGIYSTLDELCVFNPKAILPCFVVVYRGF